LVLRAPSGFGKTALAGANAAEYGTDLHTLLAGEDIRPVEVCQLLFELRYGDILFIDEAHSLSRDAQQALYVALDQNKAPALAEGRPNRSQFMSIAEFTLILATNEPGAIKKGLRSRLERVEFDLYSIAELKAIAEQVASREGVEITPQAARRLAEVAQGVPRHIARRVKTLRLFWPNISKFTQENIDNFLSSEGVDALGLWPSQRLYLTTLATSPGGCALERLSIKLGCDTAIIRQEVEPYLIDRGWVNPRSGRGRQITPEGCAIVNEITRREPDSSDSGRHTAMNGEVV
jgi:Holliday junction DNA helicase RuvB